MQTYIYIQEIDIQKKTYTRDTDMERHIYRETHIQGDTQIVGGYIH